MTSVSVQQLDNGDAYSGNTAVNGGDSADQITKLFPKCRPRADVNLNPVVPLTLLDDTQNMTANTQPTDLPDMDRSLSEHQETTPAASPPGSACLEVSSDEADHETSVKDNQVIILTNNKGGTYKLRDSRIIEIAGGREIYSQSRMKAGRKPRCVGDNSEKKYGVWDVRGTRMNDVRKQRSGREVTETVFSTEVCSVRHQRPGQQNMDTNETTSAVSGSEVVVFDDIGDDCLRASPDLDSISPERNNKVAQVIGNLPIAVYEGSPRRYGLRQTDDSGHPSLPSAHSLLASPSVYPPRPGFPQRIVTTPSEGEHPRDTNSMSPPVSSTFDYLYEFSETRKVLEEFFKCRPEDENNHLDEPEFQEHENLEQENNFLDLSVGTGSSGDLGETEVGLQVGHSRNFTLSPETTDCDSNCGDLDSEMSLMIDNDLGPLSGDMASQMDCLRLCSSMPVLEDGLSSGHASDTDNNNPTVLLMKRQITEIEREIVQKSHLNEVNIKTVMETQQENRIFENNLPTGDVDTPTVNSLEDSLPEISAIDPLAADMTPPPPAPAPHRRSSDTIEQQSTSISPSRVEAAIQDIRMALQRAKTLPHTSTANSPDEQVSSTSPVWVPRQRSLARDSETVNTHKLQTDDVGDEEEADTDLETDRLLGQQRTDDQGFYDDKLEKENKKKGRNKEDGLHDPTVLIEGVLFRARYLGSTQLVCEGQPTKSTRMMQAEEAVSRIKAPDGESQPSTEVDLFISTEKIMVLNTDLKEIMMDHALRTISYIADIGDLVVLMARRRLVPHEMEDPPKINRTPKMICHVFESEEAQFIAQSIGQAFQVAYMEFLKANGIEDHSFVKEMDYQEVLNSQEIFGDELQMFAKKEMQKEVVVPKAKGEILGVVIVESGWGSMLPTVVIANLAPAGAAARCGQLNIGDQIIAINGVSLVGLPLSTCQNYIKNSKNQTVVKLTVVPCAPVVEVKIKRPDTKYQLGFSVQNGVICSLLRGGIAERGGVRVGHRIIEINNQSVVAVPHEKIVNLLATSIGEILMKTMPTSMFRLLTGQENPVYI